MTLTNRVGVIKDAQQLDNAARVANEQAELARQRRLELEGAASDLNAKKQLVDQTVAGVPAQVQALAAPTLGTLQTAANTALERSNLAGAVGTDAELAGRPAGQYRVGRELAQWNGNSVTSRTPALATAQETAEAQALAEQADSKADSASNLAGEVQARVDAAPLAAPAQTRGTVYRGGVAYYPAPDGVIPDVDGVYAIEEASGTYYRAAKDVLPWEYGAYPGTDATRRNAGAALAQWANDVPRGGALVLPPGYWYTDREIVINSQEQEVNFRGFLRPFTGYTGYLVWVNGQAMTGEHGAVWGDTPYNGGTGGNVWQPSGHRHRLLLDGMHESRGLHYSSVDHYDLYLYSRRCRGGNLMMSLCREGDTRLYAVHSEAASATEDINDPLVACIRIQDEVDGDANNSMRFSLMEAVFNHGRALSIDSPLFDPNNPGGRPNYPDTARFIKFITPHLEGVGQWTYGPRTPAPYMGHNTFIGRTGGVEFIGGTLGAPAFQIGDMARNYTAGGVRIIGGEFYGGHDGVPVIDAQQGSYTVQGAYWRSNPNSPKILERANAQRLEQYGGMQLGAAGGDPVVSLRNRSGNPNLGPAFETQTGITAYPGGGPGVARYGVDLDAGGFPRISLTPNVGSGEDNATWVDRQGHIYSQRPVQLGTQDNPAQGVVFRAQASAPAAPATGLVVLADRANWNPLGRAAGSPYLVRWDGAMWVAVG